MDAINWQFGQLYDIQMGPWWFDTNTGSEWNPLIQDTAFYGDFPSDRAIPVPTRTTRVAYGLLFAYDPLWRYQTPPGTGSVAGDQSPNGYYLGDQFEARFGQRDRVHPARSVGRRAAQCSWLAADHQFQSAVGHDRRRGQSGHADLEGGPEHFVSQEDVVWVEALATNAFSPVLPDSESAIVAARRPWTGITRGCSRGTR